MLEQAGDDTLLTIDFDGAAGNDYVAQSFIKLAGVVAESLDSTHFVPVGIALDGTAPVGQEIFGTEGGDDLVGTLGNDVIYGLGGADQIHGEAGNDTLHGGGGHNYMSGGAGDDVLYGGDEGNYLDGGTGNDVLHGGTGDDRLIAGSGNNILNGGEGDDALEVSNYYYYPSTEQYSNELNGGAGNDYLSGGFGDDILNGGEGNDHLYDTGGINVLDGGAGDDVLHANVGSTLTGGEGKDTFSVWTSQFDSGKAPAVITDFTLAEDLLDISDLVGDYSSLIGYAGGNPFDPVLGYMALVQQGSDTLVTVDYDGAAGSEYQAHPFITLLGIVASDLDPSYFVPSFDSLTTGGVGV